MLGRPARAPFLRHLALVACLLLAVPQMRPAGAEPLSLAALPGWAEDELDGLLPALLRGCAAAAPAPAELAPLCAEAASLPPDAAPGLRAGLARHLEASPERTGLLTGYYEPELRGADRPAGPYRTPLRALPPRDPTAPLPDRGAIEAGALDGLGLELVWVDDPVDAFFLQIQGSGRVRLAGGGVLRLGFAGKNGHPYRSIGRVLIERGEIAREAMSMQAIRAWLAAAPAEARSALLRENPAYVFFRILEGLGDEEGPIGTLGVPLTPGRSIAVDPAHIPLGALVWIDTRDPVTGAPIRRLTLAQDTGGAIRGPARGDLFFGWGAAAEQRAGLMQDREARFVVLRPRTPRGVEPAAPAQPSPAPTAASGKPVADLQ